MKKSVSRLIVLGLAFVALLPVLAAQEPYKLPPKEVIDIVDAPPTPMVSMSPAGDTMALIERESMPSIAYLSEPILRIAGMRITPGIQQPPGPELLDRPLAQGHEDGPGAQGRPARRVSSSPSPPGRPTGGRSPSSATSTAASSSGWSTSRPARPRP